MGPKFHGKGVCAHGGNLCNGAQSSLKGGIAVMRWCYCIALLQGCCTGVPGQQLGYGEP